MTDFLRTVVLSPWSSVFFAGNTLDYMAMLVPAALGAAFALRCGLCNLGIEGQIYAGSCAAAVFLIKAAPELAAKGISAPLLLCAALFLAMLTGALMAGFCAALRISTGANELITSFLLSSGITPVIDYIITGPLRDTSGNLLATPPLDAQFMLPRLLAPSTLSLSFILALIMPVCAHIFLNMTASGYRFRLMGNSPDFARYGGITPERYHLPVFSMSGALGGLSGFCALCGSYGLLHQGWTGGLGWAAIAAALIARCRSLALLPAALFYAWLKSGADTALLISGAPFQAATLVQAAVLFFVTARFAPFLRRRPAKAAQ
jgi:simple sugar transport system permease protein